MDADFDQKVFPANEDMYPNVEDRLSAFPRLKGRSYKKIACMYLCVWLAGSKM